MSIVNDALKKARKEFEIKNKNLNVTSINSDTTQKDSQKDSIDKSEIRWGAIILVTLVIISSILGSLFLYNTLSRVNTVYDMDMPNKKIPEKQFNLANIAGKIEAFQKPRLEDILELNGIVCDKEGKWAIINNKIVKEGDMVLNGKITAIREEFVKIEKKDGSELVLNLK